MKRGILSDRLSLFKRGDVLFLLGLLVFFLFLLRESSTYPSDTRSFPQLIILGTLVLCALLLVFYVFIPSLKGTGVAEEPEGEEPSKEWKTRSRFFWGWTSIAISLLTAFLFGFIFLIPVSFISYTLALGRRQMFLKILLLSVATAILVYFVFDRLLGIPTLHGVLWRR